MWTGFNTSNVWNTIGFPTGYRCTVCVKFSTFPFISLIRKLRRIIILFYTWMLLLCSSVFSPFFPHDVSKRTANFKQFIMTQFYYNTVNILKSDFNSNQISSENPAMFAFIVYIYFQTFLCSIIVMTNTFTSFTTQIY